MSDAPPEIQSVQNGEGPQPQFPQANFVAVRAFADVLGSTLGPFSREKLILSPLGNHDGAGKQTTQQSDSKEMTVTSDGATLLQNLPTEHPITPTVIRVIGPERPGDTDIEGKDIPDGVTASVVLLSALLDEAEDLLEKGLHPHDVRQGYMKANEVALATIEDATRSLDSFVDRSRVEHGIARTAMTGNDIGGFADTWADLVVDAVNTVGMPDERTFVVRQIGKGSLSDSRLVRGAVLDVNDPTTDYAPERITQASVLVLGGFKRALSDPEPITGNVAVTLDSPNDVTAIEEVYKEHRENLIRRIVDLDVDVVVTRLGISKEYQRLLEEHDIMGIRRVNRLDLNQLALATGATVVTNPEDFDSEDIGHAGLVHKVMREPRRNRRKNRYMTVFEDCPNPDSIVMLLRGVTDQIADQATTEVRKAAAALAAARGESVSPPGVVPGGGAIEIRIADAIREAATADASRTQLAMEAFADALDQVVATLITNAGGDPIKALADLRATHTRGNRNAGYLLPAGEIGDSIEGLVVDPAARPRRMVVTATEVSNLILNIDDAIDATFSEKPLEPGDSIYDEEAEKHMDYLEHHDDTRWDQ